MNTTALTMMDILRPMWSTRNPMKEGNTSWIYHMHLNISRGETWVADLLYITAACWDISIKITLFFKEWTCNKESVALVCTDYQIQQQALCSFGIHFEELCNRVKSSHAETFTARWQLYLQKLLKFNNYLKQTTWYWFWCFSQLNENKVYVHQEKYPFRPVQLHSFNSCFIRTYS